MVNLKVLFTHFSFFKQLLKGTPKTPFNAGAGVDFKASIE